MVGRFKFDSQVAPQCDPAKKRCDVVDWNTAIVRSCLTCGFCKENLVSTLPSDVFSVFDASQNSLLGSESNFLPLTASGEFLKSDAIRRSMCFNGSELQSACETSSGNAEDDGPGTAHIASFALVSRLFTEPCNE